MYRVAVVGAGPSGLYAAAALLTSDEPVSVEVLDRLPAPYGLVRYGVAPDHKSIKSIATYLRRVLESQDVRFLGGVHFGQDVTRADLLGAYALGLRNLLLTTGDPHQMGDYMDATAVFDVDSIGLTNMVQRLNQGVDVGGKSIGKPTGFVIGVGANPVTINNDAEELKRFTYKVEAGAEFVLTQPVFDVAAFEGFVRRIEHCKLPIIIGILPLPNFKTAEFMHNEVPGCSVPEKVRERMRRAESEGPDRARAEGIAIGREILSALRGTVQGVQIRGPFERYETALEVL